MSEQELRTTPPAGAGSDQAWFVTREAADGVWLICEPGHVCCWLFAGRDRAVLVDTGLGIASIRAVAESLVDCPVVVANSHYHFDHVGGNAEFADRAIHRAGATLVTCEPNPDVLRSYETNVGSLAAVAAELRRNHQEFYGVFPRESGLAPLPRPLLGMPGAPLPTQVLEDGDRIELGGVTLTVMHCPGHSPDAVAFIDEGRGIAAIGDNLNFGEVSVAYPGGSPDALAVSLTRLIDAGPQTLLAGHHERPITDLSLLRETRDALSTATERSAELQSGKDLLDNDVLIDRHERFFLSLADPGGRVAPLVREDVP